MKKSFKCSCGTHLLEIHYTNTIEWINTKTKKKHKENIPEIWIGIYETYGGKSGRKLKKPKLVGDILLLGSDNYAKELDFLMHFLEDVAIEYTMRKK